MNDVLVKNIVEFFKKLVKNLNFRFADSSTNCYFTIESDGEMNTWQSNLQRGIDQLSKHNPCKALPWLQKALEDCPAGQGADLSKIFLYLGITLKKLGLEDSALRSWNVGRKLEPHGHSGKMFARFSNEYGMPKQRTREQDDWKAFYAVHLENYLQNKKSGRVGTEAEKDMIHDLIYDYWTELKSTGVILGKSACEKMVIFKKVKIVFPFFMVPEKLEDRVIPVHFPKKRRISAGDSCYCGSNQPYFLCCGRTPGAEELLRGLN